MTNGKLCEDDVVIEVCEVTTLRVRRPSRYGSALGLQDEPPADPNELERVAYLADWFPILRIPIRSFIRIRPALDEFGKLDWGPFATVDFERLHGEFDTAQYKVGRLKRELRDKVIMLECVAERVPVAAQVRIMEGLRTGTLDLDDIENMDEWFFGRRYLQIRRLRAQLCTLRSLRVPPAAGRQDCLRGGGDHHGEPQNPSGCTAGAESPGRRVTGR